MAFVINSPNVGVGFQPIATTSDVQVHPLGTVVHATHPTLGGGEFIYLKGVASTAVGNAVIWDENFATTRTVETVRGPLGIAMSANVANQFGWYQISGLAVVTAATVLADAPVSLSTTAGTLDDLTTAQYAVMGARWQSATNTPATGTAYALLSRPTASGGTNIA